MNLKRYESLIIAFFVTIVRYYDYALFGLSASLLSKNFMPHGNDGDQMLIFFAVFSLATIARPMGSLIFGKIGDKVGRVVSVKMSTVIAATSTCLVAVAPGFDSVGLFAVIIITLLRMLFLMSLAGEIDAIKIYVAEMIGKKRRHLVIGIVSFSSQIGVLFASVAYHIAVSYEDIEWLWRVNFAIGGLLGLVVIFLRRRLLESEEFLNSKSRLSIDPNGIVKIVGANKVKFVLATVINGMLGGGYHFLIIFFGTFAANVADIIDNESAAAANTMLISLYGIACLISGYISDRFKIVTQIIAALVLSILCTLVMEFFLGLKGYSILLHCILVFLVPFYSIPCSVRIQSLFQTGIRMRMCSLSHSIGSMVFSSTTPFICMLIWQSTEIVSLVLAYFLFQLGLLFFALLYMIKKDYISMFETTNNLVV
ncbi:MAG: MFS transporter [Rickettsiaceae bacterium]|nr:MFS transporter [Rickettsiaceae bacterium]